MSRIVEIVGSGKTIAQTVVVFCFLWRRERADAGGRLFLPEIRRVRWPSQL